jgi:hypothetical protein
MQLRETLFIAVVEHVQEGRYKKLQFRIFGDFVHANGQEIPNPIPVGAAVGIARDHSQVLIRFHRHFHLMLQGQRHSVDLVVGVGKMRYLNAPALHLSRRPFLRKPFGNLFGKLFLLRKHLEGNKVGRKHRIEGTGGTHRMEQFE